MSKPVVNAFHPDYMKIHEPDFFKEFRTHEANRQAASSLTNYVEKVRKKKPSHGTLYGISKKVIPAYASRPKEMMTVKRPIQTKAQQRMTMAEVTNELIDKLKRRDIYVYSKAGTPKRKTNGTNTRR